jgi:serine/threonine protein phosphatase PrpC
MLARWLHRENIGQFLAPDPNAATPPPGEATRATFWQIVAPDPNFEPIPVNAPPPSAFSHPPPNTGQVKCTHCQKWTTTETWRASSASEQVECAHSAATSAPPPYQDQPLPPTPTTNRKNEEEMRMLRTPSPSHPPHLSSNELEALVLCAAKETAISMNSPPHLKEARDKVFRLCGSQKPINDKLAKRLKNILVKDPSLIHARSTHFGTLVPDGYTPLMAAAHTDHVVAAQIILLLSPNAAHLDRDLQGRTSLHIAAELGNVNMVQLLLPKYQKMGFASPQPLDLLGRTPLGRAVTSPNPTARKRQKELEQVLFSPGDVSVYGNPQPALERTTVLPEMQLAYGIADMPGFRVTMEDAILSTVIQKDGKSYALLGVCDGHGDRGRVSQFVADNVPAILQSHLTPQDCTWQSIWTTTCLEVDAKLKNTGIVGGSTGVLALISSEVIVVANVGDSRAILIQSSNTTGLEERTERLTVSDETSSTAAEAEGYPPPIDQDHPEKVMPDKKTDDPVVLALSEDHKPDLELEKARIEKAGLKVVDITFEENGKQVTISKVERSATELIAVARAFGDFEYKQNSTLGPEEQGLVAVPDVRVHTRNPDSDLFLVLACDGVWDVMSNEDVGKFVVRQMDLRADMTDVILPQIVDALLTECLDRGSRDNMSVTIAALGKQASQILPPIQAQKLDFASPQK